MSRFNNSPLLQAPPGMQKIDVKSATKGIKMIEKNEVRKIRLGHLKSDKFASAAHARQPHLKYNGGRLLTKVEVFTVFWGGAWGKQPALISLAQSINDFFTFILGSALIDQLSEYNVPGQAISRGKLVGTTSIATEPGIDPKDTKGVDL
jgi:hypothetical protein